CRSWKDLGQQERGRSAVCLRNVAGGGGSVLRAPCRARHSERAEQSGDAGWHYARSRPAFARVILLELPARGADREIFFTPGEYFSWRHTVNASVTGMTDDAYPIFLLI